MRPLLLSLALLLLPLAACQQPGGVSLEPEPLSPAITEPAMTPEQATEALAATILSGSYSTARIQQLMDAGADASYLHEDYMGEPVPLIYYAASRTDADTLKVLESGGASWSQLQGDQLQHALINAACGGSSYAVRSLLEIGADVDWANHHGEKALTLAMDEEVCPNPDGQAVRIALIAAYQDKGLQIPEAPE